MYVPQVRFSVENCRQKATTIDGYDLARYTVLLFQLKISTYSLLGSSEKEYQNNCVVSSTTNFLHSFHATGCLAILFNFTSIHSLRPSTSNGVLLLIV